VITQQSTRHRHVEGEAASLSIRSIVHEPQGRARGSPEGAPCPPWGTISLTWLLTHLPGRLRFCARAADYAATRPLRRRADQGEGGPRRDQRRGGRLARGRQGPQRPRLEAERAALNARAEAAAREKPPLASLLSRRPDSPMIQAVVSSRRQELLAEMLAAREEGAADFPLQRAGA